MKDVRFPAIARIFSVLICSTLASCGGGGTNSDSEPVLAGQFKDSYVEGVIYKTPTQSGITDPNGTFRYRSGERVTLSVGGIVLGTVQGSSLVTPGDLAPSDQGLNSPTVINMARFLQTLDADGNPDNGITISPAARAALASSSLDFSAPAFGNSSALVDVLQKLNDNHVFASARQLVSAETAKRHLLASLNVSLPTPPVSNDSASETIVDGPAYSNVLSAQDSQKRIHLFVGGDHLYHYIRDAAGWHAIQMTGITPTNTWVTKVFVDAHDGLHVFYIDSTAQLKYASNRTGTWSEDDLAADDYLVDASGGLHVIRAESATKFAYGRATGGQWKWDRFDAGWDIGMGSTGLAEATPQHLKLVLDAQGHPHMVFTKDDGRGIESSAAYYASNASGIWQWSMLQQDAAVRPTELDLAVDSSGNPHVLYAYYAILYGSEYCSGPCPSRDHVAYMVRSPNGLWQSEIADGNGNRTSPRFRYIDDQHVGYFSGSSFTQKTGQTWTSASIPSSGIGMLYSTDTSNNSPSSFYSFGIQNGSVSYATLSNGTWMTETVAAARPVGRFIDMAVDTAGGMHISYWNESDGTLQYATRVNGIWLTETVAGNVHLNSPTSIAVNANGEVHIAYIDATTYALQHVHKLDGHWLNDTISPSTYGSVSMALDSGGSAHLLYLDTTRWAWMYATNLSGQWIKSQIVDFAWNSNKRGHLAVSPAGVVYACVEASDYESNTIRQGLWLIQKTSAATTWQFEKVDPTVYQNSYCKVSAAADGKVSLSYRIAGASGTASDKLIYATKDSGGWHSANVTTGILQRVSMTMDPKLGPVLGFYNAAEGLTSYAYQSGSTWNIHTLVDLNTLGEPDFGMPLAIDPSGKIRAIYFDPQKQDLISLTVSQP